MGIKSGFVIGFGVGYVLGSKAGRERYEDIRRWWHQLMGSPTMQKAAVSYARSRFTSARMGEDVIAVYEQVVRRRQRRSPALQGPEVVRR